MGVPSIVHDTRRYLLPNGYALFLSCRKSETKYVPPRYTVALEKYPQRIFLPVGRRRYMKASLAERFLRRAGPRREEVHVSGGYLWMTGRTFWKLYTFIIDLSGCAASMKPPWPSLVCETAVQRDPAEVCLNEASVAPV